VAIALFTAAAATAQSDSLTELDTVSGGELWDLAVDANGAIFAAGSKVINDVETSYATASDDGGRTWAEYTDTQVPEFTAVATGRRVIPPTVPDGAPTIEDSVVIAGAISPGVWRIKRSINGGEFTLLEDYVHEFHSPAYPFQQLTCAGIDPEGNVYIAGTGYLPVTVTTKRGTTTQLQLSWVVRRISADGSTRSTGWVPGTGTAYFYVPYGMVCVGETLYLAGVGNGVWQVQRSDNAATTWTAVDYNPAGYDFPYGIAAGPDGSIYVVGGEARKEETVTTKGRKTTSWYVAWGVRKGTGAAGSFGPITAISNAKIRGTAYGVTVAPSGDLYVTGEASNFLTTLRLDGVTGQLSEVDRVFGGGMRVKHAPSGNIYAAGWSDVSSWTVRGPQPPAEELPAN
jgi:hypothetical protein